MSSLDLGVADDPVWYFAYGANMGHSALVNHKLSPLETRRDVVIPNYELTFDLLSVPYNEPALANLRPRYKRTEGQYQPARGVAYRVTKTDLARMVAGEGGGITYTLAQLLATTSDGTKLPVITLVARWPDMQSRRPSQRYLGLLLSGAKEQTLEQEYQESLAQQPLFVPGTSIRYRLGKSLFDAFWLPVQYGLQKSIESLKDDTGLVPRWFVFLFDLLTWFMWTYHDYLHVILWPRGDGR